MTLMCHVLILSYRAYFAVQEGVVATDWKRNLYHGRLSPTQIERAVAPERVRTKNNVSELRVQSGLVKQGKFSQS